MARGIPTDQTIIIIVLGRLRVKCPFCGDPGRLWGERSTMRLDCDRCGRVSANVLSGLRFDLDPAYSDPSFD
ncbi:MAG: hypothetical protein ACYTKD_18965 [Planctomycetota bacterium]|jgi:uncharacterized protein (DUF983 family)